MTDEVRQEDREAAENVIRAWVLLGAGDDNQLPRYIALGIDSVASPLRTRVAELERILGVFLGHDDRFQIMVGGNPAAVEEMMEQARATLSGEKNDG